MSNVMERLDRILAKVPRGAGGTREEAAGAGAAAARLVHDDAAGEGLVLMALTRAEAAEVRAWRAEGDVRGVGGDDEENDGGEASASGPPPVDVREVVSQVGSFARTVGRVFDVFEESGLFPRRGAARPASGGTRGARTRRRGQR